MKHVLIFPTDEVREWVDIERNLKAILNELHASGETNGRITELMRLYWQDLNASNLIIKKPDDTQNDIHSDVFIDAVTTITNLNEQIARQEHSRNRKLFLEKLILEVDTSKEIGTFY